jgi:hypothetical protein
MTEDEQVDLVTTLGLIDSDVVVFEATEPDSRDGFHVLLVEGERVFHIRLGGDPTGGHLIVGCYKDPSDPQPVSDYVLMPLDNEILIINTREGR